MSLPFTITHYANDLLDLKACNARFDGFNDWMSTVQQGLDVLKNTPPPQAQAIFNSIQADTLLAYQDLIAELQENYSTMVVLGCGGSGLSSKAMGILRNGLELQDTEKRLCVIDNLDPLQLDNLLTSISLKDACFFIVSKSGETLETLAQASAVLQQLEGAKIKDIGKRCYAFTAAESSSLGNLASRYGMQLLPCDSALGGRFSLLSPISTIPAAFIGLDTEALLAGARESLALCLQNEVQKSMLCMHVAIQHGFYVSGYNNHIFLPYSERFWGMALWWRQSWAESLGKEGKGTTPICSLGTRDQHSQLQLYLEGEEDKFFTLLLPKWKGKGTLLQAGTTSVLSYLEGKTLGDIVEAEQRATAETLIRSGKPVRIIDIENIDAYTFGSMAIYFTLEILLMAELWQVNPFNQPAVEVSKQLAHQYIIEV